MDYQNLEISSQLAELPVVRQFLRDFCNLLLTQGYREENLLELELAVNEAATNIIKHAYHGREDHEIRIGAESEADRVVIRIGYYGDSFNPEAVPPPSFDGSRSNGFGVYLIKTCVDEVRYTQDAQGQNWIYLMKHFSKT